MGISEPESSLTRLIRGTKPLEMLLNKAGILGDLARLEGLQSMSPLGLSSS